MSGEISKTFQNWANSPLANYADTLVGLPGVGPAGRDKFIAEGITNVLQIMGMFLLGGCGECSSVGLITGVD